MKIFKYSDSDFDSTLKAVVNRANLDLVTHDAKVRESSSSVLNGLKKIPNELRVLHAIPNVTAKVPVITQL